MRLRGGILPGRQIRTAWSAVCRGIGARDPDAIDFDAAFYGPNAKWNIITLLTTADRWALLEPLLFLGGSCLGQSGVLAKLPMCIREFEDAS